MKRLALAALVALTSTVAFAAPVTYQIDPNHTQVLASWSHFGFSNPVANFGEASGAIVYDPQDLPASTVVVTLPLSGLNAFVPAFNEHLRSADFFEAEVYPEVTFRSTAVEAAGQGRLKVSGDLTIKGITRPVVLDATLNTAAEHPVAKRQAIGFDATTTVRRTDFGLGKFVPNVSDEVSLRITTEAMVAKPVAAR
jgi:polyisoprenoid-binding protein YceI